MQRILWTSVLTFLAAFGSGAWYSHHQASVTRAERWALRLEEFAADARLDKVVHLDGRQVTLAQLRELVARETGLEVTIDKGAILRVYGDYIRGRRAPLRDPGTLTYQLPIGRFTLRDALDRLLNPGYLAYEIRGSSLVFTTQDAIGDHLQTVIYPLPAMEQTTEDDWIELITVSIDPDHWHGVGGRGHIEPAGGALVVVQTAAIHRKLRAALSVLSELESPPESLEPRWLLPPCDPARRRQMRATLDRKVTANFHQQSLRQVAAELASRHGISLGIDVERITEAGVSIDQPVRLQMQGVTLRSVLAELLNQLELAVSDRGDSLVITTPENAENELPVVAYPVHDLVWYDGIVDFDSLIDLITTSVTPNSWDEGNNNHISPLGTGWLVLPQTAEVHAQVESLLTQLRTGIAVGGEPVVADVEPAAAAHERIRAALRRPLALDYDQVPLREVFERLAAELQIQILLDEHRLREAGVSTDLPITWHMPAVPLGSQLYWMLREPDLMWTIRDECLVITTTAETEWLALPRVYDIRNLTDPDLGLPGGLRAVEFLLEKLVPESLSPHRGWRATTEIQGLLVVSDSPKVDERLEQLLVALEKHCRRPAATPDDQPRVVRVDPSASAERIERLLHEPISVNYCGVALQDVLRDLARRLELPIAFDLPALKEVDGYNFREFVSLSAHERPLVEVLDELLAPTQYDFDIRRDVLFFTFKARRNDDALETRLYRADNLPPFTSPAERSQRTLLQEVIDETLWDELQNGPGAAERIGTEWLAARADWRQHQRIAKWLAARRAAVKSPPPPRSEP